MRLFALRLIVCVAKIAIAPATRAGSSSGATLASFSAIALVRARSRAAALTRLLRLVLALAALRACTRLAARGRQNGSRQRGIEATVHAHHRDRSHQGHHRR